MLMLIQRRDLLFLSLKKFKQLIKLFWKGVYVKKKIQIFQIDVLLFMNLLIMRILKASDSMKNED